MLISTANGCTCHAITGDSGERKTCISCRGRSEAKRHCRNCGTGLFDGTETERLTCTECYWDE